MTTLKRSREQAASTSLVDAEAEGRPISRPNMQQPELAESIRVPQGHAETEVEQHLIFLSHSGQEKDFTTRLDQALRRAGHNPFFDIHIPPAEYFIPHILQNAKECKLGVVVLSPGFLTSKWPMRELHFMHTSPSKPKILPLFFKVEPNDLNLSSSHFQNWQKKWQEFAESDPASISEWEVAVTELSKIEGVVCKENMNIEDFIEKVVNTICRIIPPLVRYDISHLTGCTRLAQEVAKLFEEIPEAPLRAIGFHGIGGQGKTTICKLMVNHYASDYSGRCVLMEFPSNSCDEKEVVRQCNKALEQLTNNGQASRHVYVDNFDQCVQRMKDQVTRHKVFIVLDNVWEVCLEFAQRILGVGFSTGSKVLATSRSKSVLSSLLKESSWSLILPLPVLNEEEARQILIKSFNCNQANTSQLPPFQPEQCDVDRVTHGYRFDASGYHPLTIGAVGATLGRLAAHDQWLKVWEHMHDDFTGPDSAVAKAIKMNFESISERRRHLFLDVAFLYIPCIYVEEIFRDPNLVEEEHLLVWLSALYRGKMDKSVIKADLKQLAYAGLLEFEVLKEVRVHDLYVDLAAREAAASGRFVDTRISMIYPEAKRLQVEKWRRDHCKFKERHFPKLELLLASHIEECRQTWLQADMPHLRMLEIGVDHIDCNSELVEWGKMTELTWLSLHFTTEAPASEDFYHQMLKDISQLRHLRFLSIQGNYSWKTARIRSDFHGLLCLNSFVNLQYLTLGSVKNLEEISGLDSLINLKRIRLHDLPELRTVGHFSSRSTQLELVLVQECSNLREIQGLGEVQNLKEINLTDIQGLGRINLTCSHDSFVNLQYLILSRVYHLEEISGLEGLINLKRVEFVFLYELLKVGHFSSRSTELQFVTMKNCRKLREIQGLGDVPNLKELRIGFDDDDYDAYVDDDDDDVELLKVGHFSSRSTQLEIVELIYECRNLIEIQGLGDVPNVKQLTIRRRLASGDMLARYSLQHLHLSDWRRMTALEYLDLNFDYAHVVDVGSIISGLPKLTSLCISGDSIKEISFIHGQLPRLESLEISGCHGLQDIDFFKLTSLSNLETLSIEDCECLEEIDWSCLNNLTNLKQLSISGCKSLKMIKGKPNGMNHTLQHLSINFNGIDLGKVEGIHGLHLSDCRLMTALEYLHAHVADVGSTVGLHGLPKLTELCINGDSIKEISFIHGQLPRLESLKISWCHGLQDIDFSKLTSLSNLQTLSIEYCECLEEIDWSCLNNLTNLERLSIRECESLKMIKGMPNGTNHTLQHLYINLYEWYQLEKVEGLDLLKGLPDEEVTTLRQWLDRREEEVSD